MKITLISSYNQDFIKKLFCKKNLKLAEQLFYYNQDQTKKNVTIHHKKLTKN